MKSVKVKLSYFSVLLLLWAWFGGCESLIDSSLPDIFHPFGNDEGDSVVNVGSNTFAGAIDIPYEIFNHAKLYVSSIDKDSFTASVRFCRVFNEKNPRWH